MIRSGSILILFVVVVCVVNVVAVNEVSTEDATTEPKYLLDLLVILNIKSQIYMCLCLVV